MKTSYGTIAIAVVFVLVFGVYSLLQEDKQIVEPAINQPAEIVIPISALIDGLGDEEVEVEEDIVTPQEIQSQPIPSLESFDPSQLQDESEDIQTGLDFLNNPL